MQSIVSGFYNFASIAGRVLHYPSVIGCTGVVVGAGLGIQAQRLILHRSQVSILALKEKRIQDLTREVATLTSQIAEKEQTIRSREESMENLEKNVVLHLQESLSIAEKKNSQLITQESKLRESLSNVERTLREKNSAVDELQQKLQAETRKEQRLQELEERISLLQQRLQEKTLELVQRNRELTEQQAQTQLLLKTGSELRGNIQQLQQTAEQMQMQRKELSLNIEKLSQVIKEKEADIKRLREEFDRERTQILEMHQQKLVKCQNKINALTISSQETIQKLETKIQYLEKLHAAPLIPFPKKMGDLLDRISKVEPLDMLKVNNGLNDILIVLLRPEKQKCELKTDVPLKGSRGSSPSGGVCLYANRLQLASIDEKAFILVEMLEEHQFNCYCLTTCARSGQRMFFSIGYGKFGLVETTPLEAEELEGLKHCFSAAQQQYENSIIK